MCDCFHLAFPNWHAPAAGAGRRLRGPELEVEDDSVCEGPEILERERPRPQGSSPVEEFPAEKQVEEEISDSAHKGGSNKKNRKVGLGSLFDKHTPDKMNETEDIPSDESEMVVKTVKEACVEGLVVTGGGKEGIFIKEVKQDSPASKHPSVKEGDQILSATVYFDNISYEDALQILEHAQPYKMEFCLKRKMEPTIPEDAEIIHPKEKDQGSPTIRSQRKAKKQQERISWPKFPSFGMGPRVQFKRSHSTSEAEEHRKLEMSPPTSDTDSPLKCPDGKDKKKKHKVQLKMKVKGYRSKSVEEPQGNEKLLVWENQQVEDILEEKVFEGHEGKMQQIPQVLDRAENQVSSKTGNDDLFQSWSGMELHEAHLISLGNTLKTTDILVALAEGGTKDSSEMKVRIHQKEKPDVGIEQQAGNVDVLHTISDPSVCDNVPLSQTEIELFNLDNDLNRQGIKKHSSEKKMEFGNEEFSMRNLDICVEEAPKKSPRSCDEKQWKERSVLENETYGIRTRGPLADMATSKTHFVSTVNGLQFISADFSEITQDGKISDGTSDTKKPTIIFQPKPSFAVEKEDSLVEIKTSKLPTEAPDFILADQDSRSASKFKVPRVDHSGFVTQELIKMTEVENTRTHLPKREDIEIPGMENKETKPSLQAPEIKVPKIEKIINITKEREIWGPHQDQEFNVEDVKVAVSKFPAFKLPEGDITGVLVQREITIMEMKSDKSMLTPRGSPHKISITSTDSGTIIPISKVEEEKSPVSDNADKDITLKMPKVEIPYADGQTSIAEMKIDYKQPQITDYGRFGDANFKLPKREDIEIPGMEAIKESKVQTTVLKAVSDADLDRAEKLKTKKHSDKKGHEKKSKKPKTTIQGFEIAKPDVLSPDISTELPSTPKMDTGEIKIHEKYKFKTPKIKDVENIDVPVQESKILDDNMDNIDLPQKTDTKFDKTKFKIPPISDGTDVNKDRQLAKVYGRAQDIETEGQGKKFKLPKFEISFPEVKAPRIICTSVKDDDNSVSEENAEKAVVHSPKTELPDVKGDMNRDIQDIDSEITEMKIKRPGFSFPRIGISKSEHTVPGADVNHSDVDMSLPEGHREMEDPNTNIVISAKDGKQKDATKVGSPTKFKIPSIKFPTFGVKVTKADTKGGEISLPDTELKLSAEPILELSDVDINIKQPEISLPEEEIKLSAEPITVNIKGPDADKKTKSLSTEMKHHDIQIKEQGSKFKLPKFGISLPELKGPKIDLSSDKAEIDVSVPKANVELQQPEFEVHGVTGKMKTDVPEADSKDIEVQMKTSGFSFPKFGFGKPDVKVPEGDVSLPNVDVSLPEGSIEMERPTVDVTIPVEDAEQKGHSKFGSPTKFKLPSINFPKFGTKGRKSSVEVSDVDGNVAGPEISLPDAETKLSVEPITVDIKELDADKEMKSLSMEMKEHDIQMKEQGSKFRLPKFGISLPEVKGPKINISSDKTEIEVDLHPPEFEVQGVTAEIKSDLPEVDSKDIEVKMKTPGFSFPKFGFSKTELKASEGDLSLPNVDMSLPEVEMERPTVDVTIPVEDAEQKGQSKSGSQTKFKLPSINLPTFGIKVQEKSSEVTDVGVDVKGPEISLPDAEMKLSAEPITLDITGPDADKEIKSLSMEMKDQDIQIKEHERKFRLPKFGINFPEVKGPKIDLSSDKADIDVSVPKAKVELQPPEFEVQGLTAEIKSDLPEVDSKDIELKMRTPGFTFPKIGFSKSELKAPEGDVSLPNVDVSLPEGSIEIERPTVDVTIPVEDAEQKVRSKVGSPTKFKMPSINFPKFGTKGQKSSVEVSDVDINVKGPEIRLPDTEIQLSAEPITGDIKRPDADKEIKSVSMEMKVRDIEIKEQGNKFKLPEFGISLPELKGPKIDLSSDKADIDVSVPKAKVELHPHEFEVQDVTAEIKTDLPEVDSKDIDLKMKTPGFSLPKFGFGKPDVKAPEGDESLPNIDVPLPEGSVELERPTVDITIPVEDAEQKGHLKVGSSTKFKLPSLNFPKFGTKGPKASVKVSDVDVAVKGPEISLPDAEIKLSAEPITVDIKGPDAEKEIKDHDIQIKEQGSKYKLPKFGFSLPEVKGPKINISSDKAEIDVSVPKTTVELHPPEFEVQGVTAEIKTDVPELDSKDIEVKMKTPGFSFPKFGFGKPDVKAPEGDVSLPNVDVSLSEGSIEMERPTVDVTIPVEDAEQKGHSKFGSPTKFKLPSINLPKFGTKGPKASVEVSDMDINVKGPEVSLPDAETKLLAEPITVDIKVPDADKEIKDQDMQIKEQGSKFKLPKFGISLPELKGPKMDLSSDKAEIDVSVPKAKVELQPPEFEVQGLTAEIKPDLPEVDSKDIEVKMKTPGFTFPKFGFGKPDVKAPEKDVSLPNVDVSLPEGSIEMERPTVDVTIPEEDAEQKGHSKFGSPTKFKLPSINLPKFAIKGPKASVEVSDVKVGAKGPEISLPDAEIKLSAEPITVDMKRPDADKEMKHHDIQVKEQGSKFKLPKFGISLPELKGPKIDLSSDKTEIDVSVPKANVELQQPEFEVQGVRAKMKTELPEVDSEDIEVKMKTPGFSFPKFGFGKPDVKAPEGDVSLPNVDVSLSEGSIEMERPTVDVTIPVEDEDPKGRSKFGSPTKFKLPSINFPKFGTKGPKTSVKVSDVDVAVKGPEISLPDAEIKLSTEPITVDIKRPDADKEMNDQDIQIKDQGSKFKLPKFGISLPEVKGPKFDISSDKAEIDVSVPKAKVELQPPEFEVQGVTAEIKTDLPEVDSKDIELKMKTSGFSFPKIGFSKSEVKAPEGIVSLPNVDVSLPEGSIEMERPTVDVTIPVEDEEQKGQSKFGSPTKFKLPSINLPKFGTKGPKASVQVSDVDINVKGPEISLPDAEIKLSAEPSTVDIKGPDADKEMKHHDIQVNNQESKFKLPKFGISLPEVKGPKIDLGSDKAEIDVSVPKTTVELHPPEFQVQGVTTEIKTALPEVDSKDIEVQIKTSGFSLPKFGFGKPDVKAPEGDVSLPNVDVSLPEGSIEMERPTVDITIPVDAAEEKSHSKFGSSTKFKLPSINFPKFGTKGPKASVEVSDMDVGVKGPEISLSDAEIKLSAEPITVDIKEPDADKEMKEHDIQIKEQGSKFKLPKFGISLPEVKGPKIDLSLDKAEIDVSVPKGTVELHPPDIEMQGLTAKIKTDLPEVDSKDIELKMKTSGFSFPKIGFSKSEVKAPECDVSLPNVGVSLPEGSIEMERPTVDVTIPVEDAEQKGHSTFGSPTKFKLPSINLPKFGTKGRKSSVEVSDVDITVKGPEISLPDAEIKLSAEPITVDIKRPDADKEIKPHDIQIKEQGSKFNLPKFGISLPEVKGPKIDLSSDKAEIDVSVPKANVELQQPESEVHGVTGKMKTDVPEADSKDIEVQMKTSGFSFPKFGFGKPDVKAPEGDVSLPNIDVSLPEGSIEMERPTVGVTIPVEDEEQKGHSKFGSPTKFKLPSINLPKFAIKGPKASVEVSDVDVGVQGPEVSLPDAEIKLSAEPITVDIKRPDAHKEMKEHDIQIKEQGSKFKLPKFGISLPEVKGPKIDLSSDKAEIDVSVPKAKIELHPPEFEVQSVTAEIKPDLPEVDSKDTELKIKTSGFSFPKFGFGKPDVKAPEGDVSLPNVDVSLPEGSIEMERPTVDITIPVEDAEQKGHSRFGSPTKFKLPSINLPKFAIKGPKASVEVSDVDVGVQGPEVSLPDAEIKLSAEPITVDIKRPDAHKEMKEHDIQIKEQGSKFKLSKFGISLPEVKGPKIDPSSDKVEIDVSVPKGTVELHPPDIKMQGVTAEIKTDLPEVDSKDIEVKMKTPGFSFPKIGFSKSQVKAPEGDVNIPHVGVSLPEGSIEMERPTVDVTISVEDAEQKGHSKFGSPTKFKLPSINLPKFGTKAPKASVEVSDVDINVKGPEISLPDTEIQLSAEPITVDIKRPDADKEIKPHDIQVKEQGSTFKLPTFEISLPEVKGPKIDLSLDKATIDISVPKTTVELHPAEFEVQGVTAEIKTDLPEVDSKDIEVKMKTPGFSFPKFGFSKSEVKAPEGDASLPNVGVSLPEGTIEMERPTVDVTIPVEDAEQKGQSKFGSPTKFKLPSINLPKFGTKGPKASVQVSDVDEAVKGPEISLPDAEIKLSTEPITVDIKGPDVDKEIKHHDIQIKDQGSKFKLPKFEINFPELKGPKFDVSSDKAETDVSVPKAKVEVHPTDAEMQGVTAEIETDLPEVDSKTIDMKMKKPALSFPRFNKRDNKVPASDLSLDLQTADVSLQEESIRMDGPTTDIIQSLEVARKDDSTKPSSQTKLKLPSIKFPKFGVNVRKETVDTSSMGIDKGPEKIFPDADLSAEPLSVDIKEQDENKNERFEIAHPKVKAPEINIVSKSLLKPESNICLTKEVKIQSPNVKVENVEINNQVAIPELAVNNNDLDVLLQPKQKFTEVKTSSKFGLPNLDVFSGFEVEFHVPQFDEIEGEKTDQIKEGGQKQTQPEINDWFRFPQYSSPTKTAKDNEKVISQLHKKAELSPPSDLNESKKSFTRETDEDNVSPTLSLSSSDAFADISSAPTTEQVGLSLDSPTKVKVKYSEPIANADISGIHGDVITSTAWSELISMEPHQPMKVNIPFSSETSSSSVDTLKQMTGHIVVSNVQRVSKTEHATILTKVDTQDAQILPTKLADSMLPAEETIVQKGHTSVEKHVVKEIFGDDKKKIVVTQTIQVFEGDSTEPFSDNTASSIQKLRDTVHTEKMRFFEGAESSKTIIMSTETLLRHADSSTDENEGK